MAIPAPRIAHPHVGVDETICGGSPIIAGTRFPVRSVVFYALRLGLAPEELVARFPHLTLAQVHDALAYYSTTGRKSKPTSQPIAKTSFAGISRLADDTCSPLSR